MPDTPARTSYDEMPYPSYPMGQTHPDHLAVVATLLGMTPAPIERCRVLELGCAAGGNLIPLALNHPQSQFIGVDLSIEQIQQGQKLVAALGLTNIALRHASILDVDDSYGAFDYITSHGVYSWVPAKVQEKMLAICAALLAPQGVGYISYNTYPGWHMRGMIRDMMYYHVSRFPPESPASRVARARSLLSFLVRSVPEENTPYSLLLREQLNLLQQHSDAYLFHEHLEEYNGPIYFREFCDQLSAHGLRYLGESEFRVMVASTSFPAAVQQELDDLAPHLIEREQYMDFLRNRSFRQTLFCHQNVKPRYEIRGEQLTAFHIASPARPVENNRDLTPEVEVEFRGSGSATLTSGTPIVKAMLQCLGEAWPQFVAFEELRIQARTRAGGPAPTDPELAAQDRLTMSKSLLTAYATADKSLVELAIRPPVFTTAVSERPLAYQLARLQTADGYQVTNLRHETCNLSHFDREILPLLDGTRDRAALLTAVLDKFHAGVLKIEQDDKPVTDDERATPILNDVLAQELPRLARSALLVG